MLALGVTELLIASIVFLVSFFFVATYNKKKIRLPPGPRGLPVLGYLPYLRKDAHVKLRDIASKYGDVFSLRLGRQLVIVLNGVDAVKEGMSKPEFLGRPPQGAFNLYPEIPSIITASGQDFHEQRRFMLNSMKDLGFGKSVLEECMKDEIQYFLSVLDNWNGQPHEVINVITPSVSNNITSLINGARYDYEDSRRKLIDDNRKVVTPFFGQTAIHIFFPWIKHLPIINKFLGYDRAVQAFDNLLKFYRQQIKEHESTLDPDNSRDYIDKFLLKMQEFKNKKHLDASFTKNMLLGNTAQLIGAGTETVQTTVDWGFYTMAAYPSVQKKLQKEIDLIVGLERIPSYSDHKHMPYTQAVIMEILRWKSILPLNVLRYTLRDTSFRGYHIPRKTFILANLWSAHYDLRYWEEPEIFKPERFLSPDGQEVIKPEAYMPFSIGRRSCPGEAMAIVELFMYFTIVLQRFDIHLQEGDQPNLGGVLTISYMAKPHKLRFIRRSSK